MKPTFPLLLVLLMSALLGGACEDSAALAKSSFGTQKDAKASPFSVISMGRDDDDGIAKKWAIGSDPQ